MTIRGVVTINGYAQPNAVVKESYWNGSSWTVVRTTTTDSAGRFAIVAGRNHWFSLSASYRIGNYCYPYGGMYVWSGGSGQFYTYSSWHNPTYIKSR